MRCSLTGITKRHFASSYRALTHASVSPWLPEQRSASDPANAAESLRGYLQQIASRSPSAHKLEQIIERFDPGNPALGVVHHALEYAYLLTSVPDDQTFSVSSQ